MVQWVITFAIQALELLDFLGAVCLSHFSIVVIKHHATSRRVYLAF